MTKRIEVKDWADKNNFFVYTHDMKPLGYVHCFTPTEWKAYDAAGNFMYKDSIFVDYFKAALTAYREASK